MASWEPRGGLYVFVCACVLGKWTFFFLKTKNKYWKLEVERCLLRHSFVLVEVIVTMVNNRWLYAEGWKNVLRDDLFSFFRSELKGKKRMGSWERFCSGFIASFTFVSPDVLVTSGLIPCAVSWQRRLAVFGGNYVVAFKCAGNGVAICGISLCLLSLFELHLHIFY
ncbi:hypothetical protein J3E68DRAFT_48952 [Trichoderma sp. SZMC 28012]